MSMLELEALKRLETLQEETNRLLREMLTQKEETVITGFAEVTTQPLEVIDGGKGKGKGKR